MVAGGADRGRCTDTLLLTIALSSDLVSRLAMAYKEQQEYNRLILIQYIHGRTRSLLRHPRMVEAAIAYEAVSRVLSYT